MFDRFIESSRSVGPRSLPHWRGGAVALLSHVAIGALGVWATLPPRSAAAPPVVIMPWPDAAAPASPGSSGETPAPRAPTVHLPETPLIDVPSLDVRAPFDATPWLGAFRDAFRGSRRETSPGGDVWSIADIEHLPALLTVPPPVYPEALRRAGVTGRVVVEAVIDTIGRAEPGSMRIIETSNRGFDTAARDYLLRALFRPARANGRPVRVLIQLPIEFAVRAAP